jgi:hypothetical protein
MAPRSPTPQGVSRPHCPSWPLIGRDDVLDSLIAALARQGPGSLVLSGRQGVGRSRLAHEVLLSARAAGIATEWFVATRAAASIPFGAFTRLLGGLDPQRSDRRILFLSAVEALAGRAGGRRLVLAVDDAHLLDQAGAALLHQVAATGTAFVVATVCTGEPVPEPIVALGRDGLGERIRVDLDAARPLGHVEMEGVHVDRVAPPGEHLSPAVNRRPDRLTIGPVGPCSPGIHLG